MTINGQDNFDFSNGINDLIPDRAELECEELFIQADRLIKEGGTIEAVEKLSQILKRNPRFGKAYNHLGWIYETKYKNSRRAEEYYKVAIAYAPNYNAARLNYCYLLSNAARFDELKTHLDEMANLSEIAKDTIANEYAVMYEMQGNPQAAIDFYRKAAIITLDSAKLDRYKDSIERCRKKIEMLSSTGE
jgi:tetratricopeptide (TPR) repeat protein